MTSAAAQNTWARRPPCGTAAYPRAVAAVHIRYDPAAVAFMVGDEHVAEISRDDAVVAPLGEILHASVSSFEHALKEYEDEGGATVGYIFLADVPLDEFDADTSRRDLALSYLGERLSALVAHGVQKEVAALDADALLTPLLDRHGAERVGRYRDDQGGRLYEFHMLALADRDRDVGALYALGVEAQALLDAAAGEGRLTAASARDLLAGGHAGALIGQPESSWIDAKAIPHRTDTETASFELAKDVAAFANTGEDALIIYGIATVRSPAGEVLDVVRPFKLSALDVPALRNALSGRVTPLLTDLEIDLVEARPGSGHGFGWIFVPAQPTWIRPVLVRGALVDGRIRGSHFSVPFQVGEDTRHWDASTVHSLIQAGRAALQQAGEADAARPPGGP